jgi:hypothetical protein
MLMPRRSRPVAVAWIALAFLSAWSEESPAGEINGWLLAPGACPHDPAAPREPYLPKPGDLVFYTSDRFRQRIFYSLAYTGKPYHVGIVVSLPDGRPAVLEAGPYDYIHVYLMDLLPRLQTHQGTIRIRRLRTPLTAEQSARLTAFALGQTGKRFAVLRIVLEITPFRTHGPIRSRLFGSARINRHSWFCSELVIASLAVAGVVDPTVMKPNTLYPRDLYSDRPFDLKPCWEEPRLWRCDP